jgi:hypothetical protein
LQHETIKLIGGRLKESCRTQQHAVKMWTLRAISGRSQKKELFAAGRRSGYVSGIQHEKCSDGNFAEHAILGQKGEDRSADAGDFRGVVLMDRPGKKRPRKREGIAKRFHLRA